MVSLFQKRELVSHLKLGVRQRRSVSYFPNHSQPIMDSNTTCVPGNSTDPCPTPGSDTGLIVGLSVFFAALALLTIVAGVLAHRKFGQLRRVLSFGSRKRIEKEREDAVQGEAPRTVKECHEYGGRQAATPAQAAQAPIYENVARGASYAAKPHNRTVHVPEDDVYLQCDAIYSNDPACNPSAHHQEDDTYIIPES